MYVELFIVDILHTNNVFIYLFILLDFLNYFISRL